MLYKGLQLDRFQEEAIQSIDKTHSVIVTAPTGAGKTVIAEYAVEKCMQTGRRVIYTAPIKALSNQKYRDFYEQYGDRVGIVTGDVVLNQYAPVLLMTTEIFRNTIFDNLTRLDDVEYVIFDEIHYINDIERGTVWEESIIFAPQSIKFVCLSATIPNIKEFSEWMQSVRDVEIDTVEELNRPVPLEHHLYLDGYGVGTLDDLRCAQEALAKQDIPDEEAILSVVPNLLRTDLVDHIQRQNRLPCLYFCFSRKGCEQNASYYAERNFLTAVQRAEIRQRFDALCARYNIESARNIEAFRHLVGNGVAYHHAGMLPTLKEVVERLFTSGLIQLLFTTETFAVGINMPACTAVFEGLEKYDGVGFRYLKTREYHQMAGRAGRRGIDAIGYVYARVNPRFADIERVARIQSDSIEPIESQFNLSYASILNLYEKYEEDIYQVCRQSLSNYQNYDRVRRADAQIQQLKSTLQTAPRPTCIYEGVNAMEQVGSFSEALQHIAEQMKELKTQRLIVKRKERGRGKDKNRRHKLAQLNREIRKLEAIKKKNLCNGCHQFKTCYERYSDITSTKSHIEMLERQSDYFENYQKNQIESRLKVLKALGYMDDAGLLPRGRIAAQICGYEVQVTQLLFKGFFEGLSADEINVLIMAIVCEPRKDWGAYRKLRDKNLKRLTKEAQAEVALVQALEGQHGVAEMTPNLEPPLSTAILAWSQGCTFEELHDYAERLADGDFVRAFRLVIDLLRQMRRAMGEHRKLAEKIDLCLSRINRDVIDAERQLRAGHTEAVATSTGTELPNRREHQKPAER